MDFPDWSRQAGNFGALVVDVTNDTDQGPAYGSIAQYDGMELALATYLNGGTQPNTAVLLDVHYVEDPSSAIQWGGNQWEVGGGHFLFTMIPALGPWVYIRTVALDASATFDLQARGVIRPYPPATITTRGDLALVDNLSVGAGLTHTEWLDPYQGAVSFWYRTTAAAWRFELQTVGAAGVGVFGHLVDDVNRGNDSVRQTFLPTYQVRLVFTNNDVGTRTLWARVGAGY